MPALARRIQEQDLWQRLSPEEAKGYKDVTYLSDVVKKKVQGRWVLAMFGQRGELKEIDIQFS
ncbi:hypothetical protein GCM10009555_053210 [Acrocarpospora macrocephala]|uniref:Uncharacterized protein n=1 Tax=Acrocarpospora macrocephala TaxID=150177 RepID=A0A5M3WNY0_9ACTN|nr:hypothetical protein [Acrocarpospora macrocephala]GES11017.1 hypothetical protein Amac_046140 [Acrocarpospora macrocephala]